jgi:hypothetical protein
VLASYGSEHHELAVLRTELPQGLEAFTGILGE